MCLSVYLSSEVELPSIPWNKAAPAFNVGRLGRRRWVQRTFGATYVYEVGAHTGCGCGFLTDDDTGADAEETAASRAGLRSYVEEAVRSGPVELLICWIGDEKKVAASLVMSPSELEQADFESAWDKPMRIVVRAQATLP